MTVTQDLDIWTLIVHASFVVKVVMFLLLAVSFMSWMFIFQKWFSIRRANAQTDKFEREFWSGNDLQADLRSALRQAKQLIEVGEVLAVDPAPHGRRTATPGGVLLETWTRVAPKAGVR